MTIGNSATEGDTDTRRHVWWRYRRGRWQTVFGVTVLVSLVILFLPESDVPHAPQGVDKIVHVLLFGALAGTGLLAGIRRRWLVPALLVYAVASELIQGIPLLGRSTDAADALADATGVLVGMLVIGWLDRRTRRGAAPPA